MAQQQKIFTRDFALLFVSQFLFSFALSMLIPTLPIYLSKLGAREEEIGILIGIFSVSSLALRPSVGKLLSRIPERRFMIAGAFLSALTAMAYHFMLPFWPFLIVRILHGVGFGVFSTASNLLAANISPETRRGQSLGYFLLSINIPFALGPALGMFLTNEFSFSFLFSVCAGSYLSSFLLVLTLAKRADYASAEPPPREKTSICRRAFPPSVLCFFISFIWGTGMTFFPLFALGHGVTNPGLVLSTLAVMLILTRLFGSRALDLYRREQIILPCLVIYVLSMVILAFSKTLPMFILAAIVWGGGHALLFPSLVAMAIDRAGPSRGLVLAVFIAAGDLGMGLGPVIMGIVLRWTSYPFMFFCLVLTGIINLSYFLIFMSRHRSIQEKNDGKAGGLDHV